MNILVSNDDGINAEGIVRLTEVLSGLGDVYVFAPDGQRSANSQALSIHEDIVIKRIPAGDYPYAREAYSVSGTPADCVKMGIDLLRRRGIETDVVYAGINHGGNLGSDTMYSGTVSAAAEGAFEGKPAVAVSVNSHTPHYFEGCLALAEKILPFAMKTAGKGQVISINTPDIPLDEIKGVVPVKLGELKYDQWFKVIDETEDSITYRYAGEPVESESWDDETDALMIRQGYATVAVVRYDLNDYEGLEEIKKWEIKL
ncbi:MAG: 5'/3'-nucleotidase SurE [Firmicutes bacterium]|nr:5'/3'-nucleotidase SurE [Bacillota bacterium]